MNWKYLAFAVLLAGWIWFSYRLYADRIFPVLYAREASNELVVDENLKIPLAFTWGSATPMAGHGFDSLAQSMSGLDSLDRIVAWRGYYFRDEATDADTQVKLGKARVHEVRKLFEVDSLRSVEIIAARDVNADVRSKPFTAVDMDVLSASEIFSERGDTAELCFPYAGQFDLPPVILQRVAAWCRQAKNRGGNTIHLIGTADGTGIAESSDVALDRAAWFSEKLVSAGWNRDSIRVTTGQRDDPHTLHNRCVLVYFEPAVK